MECTQKDYSWTGYYVTNAVLSQLVPFVKNWVPSWWDSVPGKEHRLLATPDAPEFGLPLIVQDGIPVFDLGSDNMIFSFTFANVSEFHQTW